MDRRAFILTAAGGLVGLRSSFALSGDSPDPLRDMIVINTLGGFEDPNESHPANPGDSDPGLKQRVIADAHASGVTAINQTIGYVLGKGDPYEQTLSAVSAWDKAIAEWPKDLIKVKSTADIRTAKTQNKIGVIYGFQNSAMMGNDARRVDQFAGLGVRIIQLTYNDANQVGSGCLAPGNQGLTEFGREVVARLNATRVIVDLSHSGEQTCRDAVRASKQPIAISHTGCRAVQDHPRNKTDVELREIAESGGWVGIYFMPFLTRGRTATSDDVVAHLEHAIDVCGEDHVGIGTDGSFTTVDDLAVYQANLTKQVAERRALGISAPGEQGDIFTFVIDMRGPEQFRILTAKLAARGYKSARIEKILGKNFMRYAQSVWGA